MKKNKRANARGLQPPFNRASFRGIRLGAVLLVSYTKGGIRTGTRRRYVEFVALDAEAITVATGNGHRRTLRVDYGELHEVRVVTTDELVGILNRFCDVISYIGA